MKEINKGNKEVIEKQDKDLLRQELEVNHEYESTNSAMNSVIKQTLTTQNKTEVAEQDHKKFIVSEEQKKIIDQVVLDSILKDKEALNHIAS